VRPEPDHLRPALERAQTELDARLAEACENHDADESTGQLIRLEELLTDAAHAAKEAISIRRRLGVDRREAVAASFPTQTAKPERQESRDVGAGGQQAGAPPNDPVEGIRDFVDAAGKVWHVWEVPAEQLSARARPGTYAGEFEGGWLAFESGDGTERRRLPGYPRDWHRLPNERIEALCRDALPVMKRRREQTRPPREDGGEDSPAAS
jgi:hypothetical protein